MSGLYGCIASNYNGDWVLLVTDSLKKAHKVASSLWPVHHYEPPVTPLHVVSDYTNREGIDCETLVEIDTDAGLLSWHKGIKVCDIKKKITEDQMWEAEWGMEYDPTEAMLDQHNQEAAEEARREDDAMSDMYDGQYK